MDLMESYDLKGVFFVDPMPALVYGSAIVADMVSPIVERGHEVQIHMHTEWLEFTKKNPVGGRLGRNIKDYPLNAQIELIGLARDLLCDAGAPNPNAFRAGNYGANDDTLRALKTLGIAYDSSFNPAYLGSGCDMSFPAHQNCLTEKHGVKELPIAAIRETGSRLRHAQVCALSSWEMKAALDHAVYAGLPHFVAITHSFEFLSRNRKGLNSAVRARFESLCRHVSQQPLLTDGGFHNWPQISDAKSEQQFERLPPVLIRRLARIGQQAIARLVAE
ncbi:MAG: hypothetical protein Pars2KO_12700 [Parasphingorhabdus sp.]